MTTRYGIFTAVLPAYRTECMKLLRAALSSDLTVWASAAHLDSSVRTAIPADWYHAVPLVRLFKRRAFVQMRGLLGAMMTQSLVVDLNPRSISAWLLLTSRFVLRRRTVVWGHLHAQAGGESRTRGLRLLMRAMADGIVVYTYDSAVQARVERPSQQVFVAANSLYPAATIVSRSGRNRSCIIYVGRFAPAKKLLLLLEAFAKSHHRMTGVRLVLIGDGQDRESIESYVREAGLTSLVDLPGWVNDRRALADYYAKAFVSVSPGFAGLQLTQSLGFGVPMIIARDEPHSPEIELVRTGATQWFESDNSNALAEALLEAWDCKQSVPDLQASAWVRSHYSAERMADGLISALKGKKR